MTSTPPTLTSLTTYLLAKTGRNARARLAERLAAREFRLWHLSTLAALAGSGPQSQRELAQRLAVHPSDMAKLLDELGGRGLVARERDPADRRRVLVTLTEDGHAALAELMTEAAAVQDTVLSPLTAPERTLLHGLLLRLYNADDPGKRNGQP
ncbi:MarR family winged helix-turn-helix transcriptional regulator [Streptomyces orinoci]|uniref:MarR family transcriptional regulator n=1 Tax=Streptomyces orinoci TaxID=67339 RepID=A0ABV3JZ28_STRON|nr:MarR family transcriptional regulator [Streptomyces orinoci]